MRGRPRARRRLGARGLGRLTSSLGSINSRFCETVRSRVGHAMTDDSGSRFRQSFLGLGTRVIAHLSRLLRAFDIGVICRRTRTDRHQGSMIPLLKVLTRTFCCLTGKLRSILIHDSRDLVRGCFHRLDRTVQRADCCHGVCQLLNGSTKVRRELIRIRLRIDRTLIGRTQARYSHCIQRQPRFCVRNARSV